MITRFLTVLITLTFLGFSVTAIGGKPTFHVYDVVIAGAVSSGESSDFWGYNGKQVYSQYGRHEEMNLNYFRAFFDPKGKGLSCFGGTDSTISTSPPNLMTNFGGFLRKHKKDAANGMFWFRGHTSDTADGTVLYLLEVTGEFDNPPGWPENGSLMIMPNWTLKVENEGKDVASRSCEDSGVWPVTLSDTPYEVMIVSVDQVDQQ
jgi:hypothetical protein